MNTNGVAVRADRALLGPRTIGRPGSASCGPLRGLAPFAAEGRGPC